MCHIILFYKKLFYKIILQKNHFTKNIYNFLKHFIIVLNYFKNVELITQIDWLVDCYELPLCALSHLSSSTIHCKCIADTP